VLHGAVGGIAEVINCPGLVNVDFADVRTVMSEMGMAMMGSAQASGENRARIAAEQAVASPLLEDVNLAGARGVLVNITASSTVKMKEIHEVMNTIKGFTAEEATVIVGQVLDDTMEDALRVTMVATGLGNPVARQNQKPMQIIRTGTDDVPMMVNGNSEELPSVMTSRRSRTIQAMTDSGIDTLDIPAFLRRQAD
jgi:cell division protein FtsZ